jgi:hypothetical protein
MAAPGSRRRLGKRIRRLSGTHERLAHPSASLNCLMNIVPLRERVQTIVDANIIRTSSRSKEVNPLW